MKNLDRSLLQRARAADEPVAVRAFDLDIEKPGQARVFGVGQMAAVHDCDAKPVCSRFEHQRAAVDMVDGGGFEAR